jgi:hypothetical protein
VAVKKARMARIAAARTENATATSRMADTGLAADAETVSPTAMLALCRSEDGRLTAFQPVP